MNAPAPHLGARLPDELEIFRAFGEKSFRDRKKNKVRYFAYLMRDEDAEDGLSVGLTPAAAVKNLANNEGYCRILVGTVHSLPYGLEVRLDREDPEHAYVCNLPLMSISDETREQARLIAGQLADKSTMVTCDCYIPSRDSGSGTITAT